MKINRWYCWIMTLIDSLKVGWLFNYPMSGHTFVDEEEHENCKVTVSRCENCGKVDISWSKRN